MNNGSKPRKRDRLISLFMQKKQTQPTSSSQSTSVHTDDSIERRHPSSDAKTGDRQRSRERYLAAAKLLEETLKTHEDKWGLFRFPQLNGEPEGFNDSLFREKINTVLEARRNDVKDQTAWAKCRDAVWCAFTAFSPFAKNFLTIVNQSQGVISHCFTFHHYGRFRY